MANVQPYQIIMAPFTVFVAPVGTAYPLVNVATPAATWQKLGTSGTEDYDDAGVTVKHDQKIGSFRGAGSTGVRKVSRTEEDLTITFQLADLTFEQYRHILNENQLTVVPQSTGIPGSKSAYLYLGVDVQTVALLIRGLSPYSGDTPSFMQYEIPNAYHSGKPSISYAKGKAAMMDMEWTALSDPNAGTTAARFGQLRMYTAAAL